MANSYESCCKHYEALSEEERRAFWEKYSQSRYESLIEEQRRTFFENSSREVIDWDSEEMDAAIFTLQRMAKERKEKEANN